MIRFMALNRRTFLLLASALGTGAAWRSRRGFAQDRTTLRIRSYSDLQVLDPLNRLAQPEGDIMDAIFSNLVKAKPGEKWDWQLDAAEAIEQVDERHIDFTLRKGIQFTGGFGELTAEDVKFSFERMADPKNESPYKDDWAVLDRVEVKDPYSGTIVLKEPFAPLWTISLVRGSGSIVSKKAVEAAGASSRPSRLPRPVLTCSRSGSRSRRRSSRATRTFTARRRISRRCTSSRSRTRRPPRSRSRRASSTTPESACPRSRPEGGPAGGREDRRAVAMSYVWLGMNVDNPALADIRVRQAIQKAVDVDAVLEAAYFGVAERSTGIIAPGLVGHRDVAPPKRDVEGAQQLLDRSGRQQSRSRPRPPEQDRIHLGRPGDPGEPRRGRRQRRDQGRTIPAPSGP